MNIIVTSSELQEFFGVSAQTISNWVKLGLPKEPRNKFDLKKAFDWWLENVNDTAGDDSAKNAKIVYWKAKANIEKLKEQQMRGNLIDKGYIAEEIAKITAIYRSGLSILKERLPPLLEGKDRVEIREILIEELERLFGEYKRGVAQLLGVVDEHGKEEANKAAS